MLIPFHQTRCREWSGSYRQPWSLVKLERTGLVQSTTCIPHVPFHNRIQFQKEKSHYYFIPVLGVSEISTGGAYVNNVLLSTFWPPTVIDTWGYAPWPIGALHTICRKELKGVTQLNGRIYSYTHTDVCLNAVPEGVQTEPPIVTKPVNI